jgi:hypothetical protein
MNGVTVLPKTRAVRHGRRSRASSRGCYWDKVTQNEAVFKGRSTATTRNSTKPTKNFFGLAFNFTPTWFQVWPGSTCSRRYVEPGHIRQLRRPVRRQQGRRQLERWRRADIYQKYRIDLKYNGYYGNYSNAPTGLTPTAVS